MQDKKIKLQKSLGKIITSERKNISITQLSMVIDLSKSIWSDVEKGKKDIQLSTFWRIAEGLNLKPHQLLKMIEEKIGENFSFLDDEEILKNLH